MEERIEKVFLSDQEPALSLSCIVRRSKRARRINLRISSKEKAVLTLPHRVSYREGISFLNKQKKWLEKKIRNFPVSQSLSEYFLSGGKDYNALSIFLKSSFKQVQTHPVPRQCFFPIPGIDSVLVQMERLEKTFLYSASDRSLIRRIFTQRRKQISSLVKKEKSEIRDRLESWLLSCQIAGNLRPEQISAEKWQALAEN